MLKVIGLLAGIAMLGQIALPASCSSNVNVQDVVAGVQALCQFVPTAASVESLLKANSTISTVTGAVQIVCGAVGSPPAATTTGAAPDTADKQVAVYNGTPIVGHWVAK